MNTKQALPQPVGEPLLHWQGAEKPVRQTIAGNYCSIVPLDVNRHAKELFSAFSEEAEGQNWTYLPAAPPTSFAQFKQWLTDTCCTSDPLFFVVVDNADGCAVGMASLMRIDATNGVIEVGHIHFSQRLQQTPQASEAMYLLMRQVFAWGYRRYEWKCDNLNAPSKRAATRFGFHFEGVFRQAVVYKGRNRDTAWFSILDSEWPKQKEAFESWLDEENFDDNGRQLLSLQQCVSKLES